MAKKGKKAPIISDKPLTDGGKAPYSEVHWRFTDEDLKDKKVSRTLLISLKAQLDEKQSEIVELKEYEEGFHEKSELAARYEERIYGLEEYIGIKSLLFAVGGTFFGLIFTDVPWYVRLGFGVGALICFIIAMGKKSPKKSNK